MKLLYFLGSLYTFQLLTSFWLSILWLLTSLVTSMVNSTGKKYPLDISKIFFLAKTINRYGHLLTVQHDSGSISRICYVCIVCWSLATSRRRVEVGVPCTQRNLQFGINVGYAPSCAVWAIVPQLFQVPIKIVQWAAWSRHGDCVTCG